MSSAEEKIAKIREILDSMEKELRDVKAILRGERAGIECSTCKFWSGSCQKNRINKTASDEACNLFEPRSFKP